MNELFYFGSRRDQYPQCCILTCRCMQNHNDDTIRRTTQFFRKIYLSLYLKGCVWEGVGDRTELQHIDPHSIGHNSVSFPFSWAAQLGAWGPTLLGAGFLYCIFSPTGLVSKLTDFLSSPSYIIVQRPPSCGRHNFELIQPVHSQGYNILFDRMHLLFTLVHFLFWQPERVVRQYTTPAVCSRICSRDLSWAGVFVRNAKSSV